MDKKKILEIKNRLYEVKYGKDFKLFKQELQLILGWGNIGFIEDIYFSEEILNKNFKNKKDLYIWIKVFINNEIRLIRMNNLKLLENNLFLKAYLTEKYGEPLLKFVIFEYNKFLKRPGNFYVDSDGNINFKSFYFNRPFYQPFKIKYI